ncbi:MAG TPA: hypothetical protein VMJ10_31375 [Kofleriaceae bacterium]|nr:hypothetical protein [Kofleriaceae bacterium]
MVRGAALAWLAVGCGRLDFATSSAVDAAGDGAVDGVRDAIAANIAYVGPFAERYPGAGSTDSFQTAAAAAGDAIAIQVGCHDDAHQPSSVQVSAPGWTFDQLQPVQGDGMIASATYGAIAPDTTTVTVTVTWDVSCDIGKGELGDEFAMTAPSGGATTFDASIETSGSGDCIGSITTGHTGDAIWASCISENFVVAPGSGFTEAASDGGGDAAEYELDAGPAGTLISATYHNAAVPYVFAVVAIAPR